VSDIQKAYEHLTMSENPTTLVLRNPNIQNYSDMAKITIESENITSLGEISHAMDIFLILD